MHPAQDGLFVERTPGYAKAVLDTYGVSEGDILILVNVNGINSLTIDTANECKKRGVTVIGVTSKEFSLQVPPGTAARHSSNKNLFELSDIVLDLHVPVGDAILDLPGFKLKVSASSTVMVAFMLNSLNAETINLLIERGVEPPVWFSANVPGGDEYNKSFYDNNMPRISISKSVRRQHHECFELGPSSWTCYYAFARTTRCICGNTRSKD